MLRKILSRQSLTLCGQVEGRVPLQNHLHVRFASKVHRLKRGDHGREPIHSAEELLEIDQSDSYSNYEYERFRFARVNETISPLWDLDREKFTRMCMTKNTRASAEEHMNLCFFTIKTLQLRKKRKLEQQKAELQNDIANQKLSSMTETQDPNDIECDPMKVFKQALKNCEPAVITRAVTRGGATYQVPFPLSTKSSQWYGRHWLHKAVQDRPKPKLKHYGEALAYEVLEAYDNRGQVVKRKDDMHRLAEANKAFSHYRWG